MIIIGQTPQAGASDGARIPFKPWSQRSKSLPTLMTSHTIKILSLATDLTSKLPWLAQHYIKKLSWLAQHNIARHMTTAIHLNLHHLKGTTVNVLTMKELADSFINSVTWSSMNGTIWARKLFVSNNEGHLNVLKHFSKKTPFLSNIREPESVLLLIYILCIHSLFPFKRGSSNKRLSLTVLMFAFHYNSINIH